MVYCSVQHASITGLGTSLTRHWTETLCLGPCFDQSSFGSGGLELVRWTGSQVGLSLCYYQMVTATSSHSNSQELGFVWQLPLWRLEWFGHAALLRLVSFSCCCCFAISWCLGWSWLCGVWLQCQNLASNLRLWHGQWFGHQRRYPLKYDLSQQSHEQSHLQNILQYWGSLTMFYNHDETSYVSHSLYDFLDKLEIPPSMSLAPDMISKCSLIPAGLLGSIGKLFKIIIKLL